MEYLIQKTTTPPSLNGEWDGPIWQQAMIGEINHFLPQSSEHHPRVAFKMLHDTQQLFLIFRVEDRYVRSLATQWGERVCLDSCVELFIHPPGATGYFNIESNCGGNILCYYIEDPTRVGFLFEKFTPLTEDEAKQISVYHSLPAVVDPEITTPVTWIIEFHMPFAIMENYAGSFGDVSGQSWRGNLQKCADETSHPHWATWAPINAFNFHLPECFGTLRFG